MQIANGARREVVLVGGGHAHVQVLRHFAMRPPPRARLTLVVDTPVAVYSGMVPGFAAGQYRAAELEIDVLPLARRAAARVVLAPAVGIDAGARSIEVEGRPSVPYDLASIDIGSTVAGLDLPGIREHALPTRPIGLFVRRLAEIDRRWAEHSGAEPFRVVVVGGGVGGVELAFALEYRLRGARPLAVTLLQNAPEILPGYPVSLIARARRRAAERGVEILCNRQVEAAEEGAVSLAGGERFGCDALLWVTGAASQPIFRDSGLPTEARGFVRTRSTLQVEGHDELFAVGDCATLNEFPDTPKAGVYAVRQGPHVTRNLRAALAGDELETYRPQRDFLTLLNLGDGRALGAKWGRSFEGRWVMTLKDRIDRRFLRRFQVLDETGGPSEEFAKTGEMDAAPGGMAGAAAMLCGGCAAKVGQSVLERALARLPAAAADPTVELGLATPDDAAAICLPSGDRVVTSLDAFQAFTDDPYLVGRVAAVNAVSDLQAKGVEPRYALALVALPETAPREEQEESLFQVLSGARATLDPLGVTLLGGHSTTASKLLVGFQVEGTAAAGQRLLRLDGLEAGQRLVLSKALGTGVLFHADMQGLARGPWIVAALTAMQRSNAAAARVARAFGATGATDVTGFGLAGHLAVMARAAGVSSVLDLAALPTLPGALELLARGLRSTFHAENERAMRRLRVDRATLGSPRLALLFDPQTSGGLLFGVPAERAADTVAELHRQGDTAAAVVGRVEPARPDGAPIDVRGEPASLRRTVDNAAREVDRRGAG